MIASVRLFAALLLFLIAIGTAWAVEPLRLGAEGVYSWAGRMAVVADPRQALSPDQAFASDRASVPSEPVPAYGYAEGATWVRLTVDNAGGRRAWFVRARLPDADIVDLYVRAAGETAWRELKGGVSHVEGEHDTRPYPYPVFELHLPEGSSDLMLRVVTLNSLNVDVAMVDPGTFAAGAVAETLTVGLMFGATLAMIAYYFMVWLALRSPRHLWYVLYSLSVSLAIASSYGLTTYYSPINLSWNHWAFVALDCFGVAAFVQFGRHFLDTPRELPWGDRVLRLAVAANLAVLAFGWLLGFRTALTVSDALILPSLLAAFVCGLILVFRRRPQGVWFVSAEFIMLLGSFATVLQSAGVLPVADGAFYELQLGTTVEVLVLAIALARGVDRMRREKEQAEIEARLHAQRATTDPLTGLGNRAGLESALARLEGEDLTVAVIDLDGMKTINDTYGHACGDEFLCAFARLMTDNLRAEDRGFRVGGDEFVLILRGSGSDSEVRWRDRLGQVVATLRMTGWPECGASIGFASLVEANGNTETALGLADRRMYEQKKQRPHR